jgi:hypothetical protein
VDTEAVALAAAGNTAQQWIFQIFSGQHLVVVLEVRLLEAELSSSNP